MRAMLLAAGLGTRLRPLTDTIPKCLVPINGKPLLGYWLDALAGAGITSILINLHHHPNQVRSFVEQRPDRDNIRLVFEEKLLGTAGTVRSNAGFCAEGPTMVIHADNFCKADLSRFIESHNARPPAAEITMMTFISNVPSQCGVVELDEDSLVVGFHEKVKNPPSRLSNGAVYIFEDTVIEYIAGMEERCSDISVDVVPHFMGKIFAVYSESAHIDIGTPEKLAEAQQIGRHSTLVSK